MKKSKNEHPTSLRKRYDANPNPNPNPNPHPNPNRMATSYGAQDEQGDKRTRNY